MGDYGAIAEISETLLRLLRSGMNDVVAADHIVFASPGDVELDTSPAMVIFLYQVAENVHLKNQDMEQSSGKLHYPPYVVDLFYLVVPYAQSRETEYLILGKAMQILSSISTLKGSLLTGSMAGTDEEVRILHHNLSMEDLLRIWTGFINKPYKLSVAYQVTPVKIERSLAPVEFHPVVERVLRLHGDGAG